jgi:hypothetical protein
VPGSKLRLHPGEGLAGDGTLPVGSAEMAGVDAKNS